LAVAGRFLSSSRRSLLEQLAATDGRFLKWASLAILRWRSVAGPTVPIVQIHGDRDRILPHALTHPDVLVAGAGHALPVTHPIAVNQFLCEQLDRFAG
jgi:pimeloyl-ACP methyl ester carboxylesterase